MMANTNYLEGLLLGKGVKVKDLIDVKYTNNQIDIVQNTTKLSEDEILELSNVQFDAILTRVSE